MHSEAGELLAGLVGPGGLARPGGLAWPGADVGGGVGVGRVGVGVDVEEVARWERPAESLFTAAEHAYCRALARPAQSYAGRWCAKEAVLKALSPFLTLSLRDIEIGAGPAGAPQVRLAYPACEGWDGEVRVSIAHTPNVAVAVAVAVAVVLERK